MGELEPGDIPLHPLCRNSQEFGCSHQQGEICEFGHLDTGASRGIYIIPLFHNYSNVISIIWFILSNILGQLRDAHLRLIKCNFELLQKERTGEDSSQNKWLVHLMSHWETI